MKEKHKGTLKISASTLTAVLYFFSIGGLASCAVGGWYYLETSTSREAMRVEVEERLSSLKEDNITSSTLPALNLNQQNQRQGPEVVVDPNALGKENPFQ